jgi:chemotaxis protein methyltransferase CheR
VEIVKSEISDAELEALTNAIRIRYGIDFTNYETKSLKRGFARLIGKYHAGSLMGIWQRILQDREFFMGCIDDLMVNLTELFRNVEVWTRLRQEARDIVKRKGQLRTWHAGCSTGEEVYSMAILLAETGLRDKAVTLATDLSATALATAIKGEYPAMLWDKYESAFLKYYPTGRLTAYMKKSEESFTIKPSLTGHISFGRHNLACEGMAQKFDLIFCRNVMIYFDDALKMKVLNLFHQSLEEGGFLVIGYYDMMPEGSKKLFDLYDPVTRIYRKARPATN